MVKAINRLMEYLKYKDLKQTVSEKKMQLWGGYVSKTENRNGSLGSDVLNRIALECPDLSMEWLITGRGEMLKGSDDNATENQKKCEETNSALNSILNENKKKSNALKKLINKHLLNNN
jgi:hypothetical protein